MTKCIYAEIFDQGETKICRIKQSLEMWNVVCNGYDKCNLYKEEI